MCINASVPVQNQSDALAEKLLGFFNGGAMSLMISVGHRTGLFDTMGAGVPATSAQIAACAGLAERPVREWLHAMVAGGIVEHDADAHTYRLPKHHAAMLTRAASPGNFAVTAQWIGLLGAAEDSVVESFRHGRGVPYSRYGRFHEVMAEESSQTVVAALEPHILPLVPWLVESLERGIEVLDVACGRGEAMIHLAHRFPRSRFTGIDVSREAISSGVHKAESRRLRNVTLKVRDAASLHNRGAFDLVTAFDAIHDQVRPTEVLTNIRRSLRTGGWFLMQDIKARTRVDDNAANPLAPFLYTVSCMHCMSVSLAGGGPGLGAAWGKERALEMLAAAGFEDIRVAELPHDMINYYYLSRVN